MGHRERHAAVHRFHCRRTGLPETGVRENLGREAAGRHVDGRGENL